MSVRVRFAPSPTGFLHIGGARTALFNWLYARHHGGQFILRIEDTDAARNSQESINVILDGLRWLGLDWDEGPASAAVDGPSQGDRGPYFQSQRSEIYRQHVDTLLSRDLAYESDGTVKFRMPQDPVIIPDLIAGDVNRKLTDREEKDPDFIIVRSDGQPVFHLVNVVDDLTMGITHVIRGKDHLSNTSKHIQLFKAFDATPPQFAHIPLILNKDGSKMSKRDQGASLTSYQEEGYSPEAVLNYLALLGWSPKDDKEIMPLQEIIQRFDLAQVNRSNACFDLDKLKWMNYEYLRHMSPESFRTQAIQTLKGAGFDTSGYPDSYIAAAVESCRDKVKVYQDIPPFIGFYFVSEPALDPEAVAAQFNEETRPVVESLEKAMEQMDPFTADAIQEQFKSLAKELGVKVGKLVHPTRLACTGSKVGPSLYTLMEILGKEKVLQRFKKARNG